MARPLNYSTLLCIVVLLLDTTTCVQSSAPTTDSTVPESTTLSIVDQWKQIEKRSKLMSKEVIKNMVHAVWGEQDQLNISSTCANQGLKILTGIRDLKTWAFSFFDASAKMIDGTLFGAMSNYGEYDQCLSIEAKDRRKSDKVLFRGQYCILEIKPPLPPKKSYYKLNEIVAELKNFSQRDTVVAEAAKSAHMFYMVAMRLGICIPSGCTENDLSQITNTVSDFLGVKVSVKGCEIKEDLHFTPRMIGIMCLFSFFGLLLLIGTLIEVVCYCTERKVNSLPVRCLLAFSFVSNFKKLVHFSDDPGPLTCFGGLRVLSIIWIILGHTYLNINLSQFHGLRRVVEFPNDFAFQAVINATVSVDTFFFMGGVLVCYLSLKIVKEMKRPFNIFLYIFHRLFRILPIYAMVIAFIFLAPLIGSGPTWHDTIDPYVTSCESNWWENLLFINNFYHSEKLCLPHSWYVSCDFQLYILALSVLLPLFRWPKVGLSIAGLFIIASMVGTALLTHILGHPPTMLYAHPDLDDRIKVWSTSYFKPYSHAGPYFMGMIIGYILVTKPKLRLSLPVRIIGWCSAVACNLAVLYGVWEWNKGVDPTFLETILYSGCHRVAWTFGVAWVVVNCAIGQGGVVNYILTWKCWTVLGRLTYAAYLIHPISQVSVIGMNRMNLQPWHWFAVWIFFGHLMVTFGSSFVAAMLIEAPFLSLEKLLFSKQLKDLTEKDSCNDDTRKPVVTPQVNGQAEHYHHQPQQLQQPPHQFHHQQQQQQPHPVNRLRAFSEWNNAWVKNGPFPPCNGHWRSLNNRTMMDNMNTPNHPKNRTMDHQPKMYRL